MIAARILLAAAILALPAAAFAQAVETPPSVRPGEAAPDEGVLSDDFVGSDTSTALSREQRIDALLERLRTTDNLRDARLAESDVLRLWLESGSDTVDLLMTWSLKAVEAKNYALALDFLDRITLMKPDYAEGWNKRATVHFMLDDYSRSLSDIGRTLAIEPRHFPALSGLGAILRALGEEEKAIEAYRQALAIDPHLEKVREALDELETKTGGKDI